MTISTRKRSQKTTKPSRQKPHTEKGQRRREKLREVATKLLEECSYHELTLEQIATGADIPTSVFYHYFSGKKELVLELLDDVFDRFEQTVLTAGPFGSFENGVAAHNRELLRLYNENAGLMRCLTEVDEPEFAQSWREKLNSWHKVVVRGLSEFTHPKHTDANELTAVVKALSGTTEAIAHELYVVRAKALRSLLPNIETATDFIVTLWVRALFLKESANSASNNFMTLRHLRDLET